MAKLKIHNKLLLIIGDLADKNGLECFLVGGAVRDLLKSRKHDDIDVVVVGKARQLVQELESKFHASFRSHERFGTYVVSIPNKGHIDVVTARKETYPAPGKLPVVKRGTLRDDLKRRDFSVNAMALSLNMGSRGELIDHFEGRSDLDHKILRILHSRSFIDDPTRILRLVRFMARGYGIAKDTAARAKRDAHYLTKVSRQRITKEILLILEEQKPWLAFEKLLYFDCLKYILPDVDMKNVLKEMRKKSSLAGRLSVIANGFNAENKHKLFDSLILTRKLRREVESLF